MLCVFSTLVYIILILRTMLKQCILRNLLSLRLVEKLVGKPRAYLSLEVVTSPDQDGRHAHLCLKPFTKSTFSKGL